MDQIFDVKVTHVDYTSVRRICSLISRTSHVTRNQKLYYKESQSTISVNSTRSLLQQSPIAQAHSQNTESNFYNI
jgi:hypothetical protein